MTSYERIKALRERRREAGLVLVTTEVPADLIERLRAGARARGMTMQDFAVEVLRAK